MVGFVLAFLVGTSGVVAGSSAMVDHPVYGILLCLNGALVASITATWAMIDKRSDV